MSISTSSPACRFWSTSALQPTRLRYASCCGSSGRVVISFSPSTTSLRPLPERSEADTSEGSWNCCDGATSSACYEARRGRRAPVAMSERRARGTCGRPTSPSCSLTYRTISFPCSATPSGCCRCRTPWNPCRCISRMCLPSGTSCPVSTTCRDAAPSFQRRFGTKTRRVTSSVRLTGPVWRRIRDTDP